MPKKSEAAKKEKDIKKLAVDSTFGIKNKNKSQAVQNIIKNIAAQSKGGLAKLQSEIYEEKKKQEKINEEKKLLADVFAKTVVKPVIDAKGEEVKICQFFKAGLCQKGKKCKFSHDLTKEPVVIEKIDLYTDQREILFMNKEKEVLEGKHLLEAVEFNEGKYGAPNKTDKICKHFLEAVEKKRYGWMWVCPNGYDCIFRHCLPQDYVFENDKKKEVKKDEELDIIEDIDKKRDALESANLTPLTEALFFGWLKKRKERRRKEAEDKVKEEMRVLGLKAKKNITGRQLFENDQVIFMDDEDAVETYEREEVIEEAVEPENIIEGIENLDINEDVFANEELPDF